MKRLLIVLVTVMTLMVSGCFAKANEEEPTPTPSPSVVPTPTPTPQDQQAPVITLSAETVETTVGKEVELPTATATDNVDGDLEVTVTGTVDWNKSGNYVITYTAIDSTGNQSQTTVVVTVKGATVNGQNTSSNQTTNQTATAAPTVAPTTGCDAAEVKDPDLPCGDLVDWDVSQYKKLYSGESYDACVTYGTAIKDAYFAGGEQPDETGKYFESFTCEGVTTNDWTFWGYGLKINYHGE